MTGLVFAFLIAVLAACTGSASDTSPAADDADVIWDLRTPIGAIELGTTSDSDLVTYSPDLVSFTPVDGEVLLVVLPTGDRIRIENSADAVRSNFFGGNPTGGVVDQLRYSLFSDGSAADVRQAADDFTEQWGAAMSEGDETIALPDVAASLTDDVEYDIGDRSAERFQAIEVDGILAGFAFSVTRADAWGASVSLHVRPTA